MATAAFNIRMDADLKRDVDEISKNIGLSTAAVFNVFARQFVARRGFPFEVSEPVPTEEQYAREMDERYDSVKKGNFVVHDLIEA